MARKGLLQLTKGNGIIGGHDWQWGHQSEDDQEQKDANGLRENHDVGWDAMYRCMEGKKIKRKRGKRKRGERMKGGSEIHKTFFNCCKFAVGCKEIGCNEIDSGDYDTYLYRGKTERKKGAMNDWNGLATVVVSIGDMFFLKLAVNGDEEKKREWDLSLPPLICRRIIDGLSKGNGTMGVLNFSLTKCIFVQWGCATISQARPVPLPLSISSNRFSANAFFHCTVPK
jgi:hypothetical protein